MAEQWQNGEGWEWVGSGGGANSGGDGGGGWSSGWPPAASAIPPPPGHEYLTEAHGKGYNKGWNEGRSAGFTEGFQSGVQHGNTMWGGKGKGSGGWQEEEAEAAEPGEKQQQKKKKTDGWKEWNELYTAFDPDKQCITYFYTRTSPKKLATYPQEIQHKLLMASEASETDNASKDIEYDMTQGWLYKLRIFGGSEQEHWNEKLSEIRAGDGRPDGKLVGAQWRMQEAMADPPKVFEKGVKFRPIFYSGD